MIILGIETSCDETSVGIIKGVVREEGLPTAHILVSREGALAGGKRATGPQLKLLSNVVSSSLSLHAKTEGIIPEIAAREQIKFIIPVIKEALQNCELPERSQIESLDSIAVTYGPGLMGSLLVGVETAKTLSYVFDKPLIPVNHLLGHIYANYIEHQDIELPALSLVVSGGHTDLLLIRKHGDYKWLGGTRDDAAGEAFDKIARLLGLPYPGGPAIEKEAVNGNPKAYNFPKPMINSNDFDFSFSGLKTAVLREVGTIEQLNNETIEDISASVQKAIVDVLVQKTLKAAEKFKVKSILLGGGVAANQKLRDELNSSLIINHLSFKLFVPTKSLCTDNGAMIAAAAFYNYKELPWQKLSANPQLYF